MKVRIFISSILLAAVAGMAVFFMLGMHHNPGSSDVASGQVTVPEYIAPARTPVSNQAEAFILPMSEPSYIPILNSNVPRPRIDAKSAIIYDGRSSRFLYQENIRLQAPIASLTKVMTAAVVLEKLNAKDVVTVTQKSLKVDGLRQDLYMDEKITVENLLKMMLVESSNDAAVALAEHAKTKGIDLVKAMNERAQAIGMEASVFKDPAGLDDTAYSTVYDLIKLVQATSKYREIWIPLTEKEIQVTSADGKIVHTVKNTDELLGVIPNIIGGKTGFTDGAQGCLILIVGIPEYNDTIVSVVMGSHDRFGDTKKIVDWIKTAYRWE